MTKKIFRSTIAVVNVTLFLCLSIVMGVLYGYFHNLEREQLKTELRLIEGGVKSEGLRYLENQNFDTIRVTLINSDGIVIYDSDTDIQEMDNHLKREEVAEALKTGVGESSRYSSTLMKKSLYYATLMEEGNVLRISVSVVSIFAIFLRVFIPVAVIFVIAILVSVAVVKHIAGKIVEPLTEINLDKPLENENAYEELAPLLGKINKQRKELSKKRNALRQREDEFRQITNYMDEGLVLLNERSEIVSINEAACHFFDLEEVYEGTEFIKVDRNSKMLNAVTGALNGHNSELLIPKNGGEYRVNINKMVYEGEIIGAVILIFDVTEQAFFRRNRQEFTANVSHELKTPLQSIIGSAELIENNMVKQEDMSRFVGHIRSEAQRMVTLVNDTIHLSQLDEKIEQAQESVDIYEIAKEVVTNLSGLAMDKNVKLNLTGTNVRITAVKKYIYEIIHNLCDNAIRYNVNGGSVDVDVFETGITVADTGIGILAEHHNRIFERFYRVDKSHSRETGGTGLGLSIVKNAVQYMGGQISLNSDLGVGTTVKVLF